ncbi:MAG: hypothetical protein OEX19_12870, partial [Gammaproteobacteria bacterium]|nr:hypothetical protein [Gammaproteobacteria bacterium]
MSGIRQGIEKAMERFGYFITDRRYIVLILMLMVIAAFVSQVPKITIDTSNEGFLHEDDPILLQYNKFRAQYGREEMIMLAITAPDIFDMEFLEKLKNMHAEIEGNVPH